MATLDELEQERQALQDQLQANRIATMRAKQAERRAAERQTMTVDQAKVADDDDRTIAAAFSTPEGQAALEVLQAKRPIVADEIAESLARVSNVASPAIARPVG